MRLYGKTFLLHDVALRQLHRVLNQHKNCKVSMNVLRSIISLLFIFLFLLLVSFVCAPLVVLEFFYYFVSHLVSGWQNILNSMHGARQNINNFYGLLAIITLHTFSSIWTYVTRVLYIEELREALQPDGIVWYWNWGWLYTTTQTNYCFLKYFNDLVSNRPSKNCKV